MHSFVAIRKGLLAAGMLGIAMLGATPQAHAVSKEIVELQTQVQQLMNQVQQLQSTLDSRMAVLQHLAEQTADAANQMTTTVNALQQKLNTQNDANGGKLDTMSGQVQSLNDSVDELKARIAKLDKAISDMQTQLQTMQTPPPQTMPGATPGQPGATGAPAMGAGAPGTAAAPAAQQAPPLQETLQSAERDFDAGRYAVAQGEFQDVIHYYPLDDMAGTAQFYLGEIAYQQKDYATAISAYNNVLEGFSGNSKAPAAQLHKGYALLAEGKREEGIHELRSLIARHPQTPEARTARSKLNAMGVKPTTAAH